MRGHLLTAILAIAVSDVAVAAEVPATGPVPLLSPSSPWNIYSTKDRCVLARDYGAGPDAVTMAFRPLPLSDLAEMRLVTNTKKSDNVVGTGVITLLPGAVKVEGYSRGYRASAAVRRTTSMYLSQDGLKALPQSTEIEMAAAGERTVRIKLTKIAAALNALKACNDDIAATWGVDIAEQARVVTPAVRTSKPLVTGADYPMAAVMTVAEAETAVMWRVGPDKLVSGCKVVSGNDPLFDKMICKAINARARYTEAALDAESKPVASYIAINIIWHLPDIGYSPPFSSRDNISAATRQTGASSWPY